VRIALFCPSYGQVGGIEAKAERLIAAFRGRGHAALVLARGEPATSAPDADVPVLRLAYRQMPRRARHVARQIRFLGGLPQVVGALRRALIEWRADAVLGLTIPSYAPYEVGMARAVPLVLSLEIGGPGLAANPLVVRWALRPPECIVACAASLARTAVRLAPDAGPRVPVIPNGVDPEAFADGPAFPHPHPYVLAVARLSRQKGVDLLLRAFARLRAGDLDLLVAGDGPERAALFAERDRLGLGERVHFLGTVEPASVACLYRGALVVACPSRWEGLPLVCLEAMASARAVVAAAVDGVPDAVADGETGLLVPPEDPEALADALGALLADPARRRALGARGRTVVCERFAWPVIADRYLDVLEAAAATRR